jgi:hypothetical protein
MPTLGESVIRNVVVLWLTFQSSSRPQAFVTIHVDVKPNKETFIVHKNLICHHSPFFEAVFNSSMKEGQTQTMTLEDVESGAFGLLVNWLYTQKWRTLKSLMSKWRSWPNCGPLLNASLCPLSKTTL